MVFGIALWGSEIPKLQTFLSQLDETDNLPLLAVWKSDFCPITVLQKYEELRTVLILKVRLLFCYNADAVTKQYVKCNQRHILQGNCPADTAISCVGRAFFFATNRKNSHISVAIVTVTNCLHFGSQNPTALSAPTPNNIISGPNHKTGGKHYGNGNYSGLLGSDCLQGECRRRYGGDKVLQIWKASCDTSYWQNTFAPVHLYFLLHTTRSKQIRRPSLWLEVN